MTGNGQEARCARSSRQRRGRLGSRSPTSPSWTRIDPFRQTRPRDTATALARRADRAARDHEADPPARPALRSGVEHEPDEARRRALPQQRRRLGMAPVEASKAARWLGYVPFDRIIDDGTLRRIVVTTMASRRPRSGLARHRGQCPRRRGHQAYRLPLQLIARQKYRLVVFGEKTSLAEVAKPLCRSTGRPLPADREITDSQLWLMAKTGAEDGRPMVVFALTDFDPSGTRWRSRSAASCKHSGTFSIRTSS